MIEEYYKPFNFFGGYKDFGNVQELKFIMDGGYKDD